MRAANCGVAALSTLYLSAVVPDSAGRPKWLLFCVVPICALFGLLAPPTWTHPIMGTGQAMYGGQHPIEVLVANANVQFDNMLRTRSNTLSEAVISYRQRYHRNPPPYFDRWFEMAQDNQYILIDEFDTIMESLEPFWGIDPADLRDRVDFVANTAPMVVRYSLKNHQIQDEELHKGIYHTENMDTFLKQPGWLEMLPDMTFLVNQFDEPRGVWTVPRTWI
jgi:hypothetical protein